LISSDQKQSAVELQKTLVEMVDIHCKCVAMVSLSGCEDVVVHYERDIERLLVIHPEGVHPSKLVGYLMFWTRKLKPISCAYKLQDIVRADDKENLEEMVLINEMAAIFIALHLTLSYAADGILSHKEETVQGFNINPSSSELENRDNFQNCLSQLISAYLFNKIDRGHGDGNIFTSIIYDMRYRTFGPHHVVHFINHLVYAARAKLEGEPNGKVVT